MTFPDGLTYDAFLDAWQKNAAQPLKGLSSDQRKYVFYARYNAERSRAVHAEYAPSPEARAALASMLDATGPQRWTVLTEDWCSDSAFSLPVLADLAALSDAVTLRILPRDSHLSVMDRYLTNGGRSIPKLVATAESDGSELFLWGPRPEAAQQRRAELVAEGEKGPAVSAKLAEWYAGGGWRETEGELVNAFQAVTTPPQSAS